MSEPTVEEMVEWWDKELYPELMRRVIWDFLDHGMFKAIRKRLEKPTVSREWVEDMARGIVDENEIREYFTKLGIEVEEASDE